MNHDELNEQIFSILSRNARTSNREVAEALGISETAVRKRLAALERKRSAKLTTLISVAAAGMEASAFVRLQVKPVHQRAIAAVLKSNEAASYVALTTGRFNVTALFNAATRVALAELVHSIIQPLSGVHDIEILETVAVVGMRLDVTFIRDDR